MNDQVIKEIADKILHSICDGKEELLALGVKFNKVAIANKGQDAFNSSAYEVLAGKVGGKLIKRIDGIELIFDAKDHFILDQVNRLPWTKEQRRLFFRAYYADDTRIIALKTK